MRLNWSGPALNDLRAIDDYLSGFGRDVASRYMQAILTTAERLADFPGIGPALDGGVRSLRARSTPYVLLYRIEKDGISLLRIRHDRQNWRSDGQPA